MTHGFQASFASGSAGQIWWPILGAVLFLLVTPASPRSGTLIEPLYINGAYWRQLNMSEKQGLVVGMVVGFDSGWSLGARYGVQMAPASPSTRSTLRPGQLRFTQSVTFYVRAIDEFYAKNPQLESRVPVGEIFSGCLGDQPILTCDAIAKYWTSHPPGAGI